MRPFNPANPNLEMAKRFNISKKISMLQDNGVSIYEENIEKSNELQDVGIHVPSKETRGSEARH